MLTLLSIGFVAVIVFLVLLMSDVRELQSSVSDARFRLKRLERRLLDRSGKFDESPRKRMGGLV